MQGRNSLSRAGEGSLTLVAPPGVKYPICPLVTAWSRDWGMAKGEEGGWRRGQAGGDRVWE